MTDVPVVGQLFVVVALSLLACHALHIMSSCTFHLHTCSSHESEHFPCCPFCIPAFRSPPVVISTFFSCVGIKHFRIGPRLAKRPWFTTGRQPVKFRTIWTSFDAPTDNYSGSIAGLTSDVFGLRKPCRDASLPSSLRPTRSPQST